MKVLTSRVVVFAIVSILTSFVAHAESKAVGDGDKTGDVTEDSKSDSVSIEGRKIVASKSYVDDEISALAAHTINGAPLSNATNVFFGVGEGAASSGTKTAQVPSIPVATFGTVPTGVIITVQPEYTAEAGFVLSLNGGRRANVLYNGVVLTNADAPKIWNSKYPSTFVFNGASWVFMGSGAVDENTEYDVMGVDEGTTGAATDERTLTAANLKPIIQGTTLTNIDTTATTAVTASDTITTGIGKLQGQINALGANTLTWGASEATSANAYDTTFVGDTGATANAWPTADKTKLIDTAALANALALKQNKITTGGVTETLYSRTVTLPALASYNYSTNDGLVANTVGLLTNTINNPNPIDWDQAAEEDPYSQTDLDNVVPTIKLIAKGFRRLYWWPEGQGIPYTATQLTNAINTYSTTFDPTPTHVDGNWPSQMALGNTPEDTIVSAKVFAQGLALKQNKIAAGTAGNVVTYSGTAGQFGTPLSIMDGLSSYGEVAVLVNAYNFGDPETSQTTVWPLAEATRLINGRAFAEGLSLKQTLLPVTSNGMGNTPNYVYNATTNPTADGSVVTTTATAGIVGERGIATAPVSDGNGGYSNGDWLPTVNAMMNAINTATNTLSWTATETTAAGNYSTTFDGTTGNWPAADADKLIDGTGLATALSNKQNKIVAGTAGNVVTYSGTAGTVGSATVSSAATYTNGALTNGDDIANITAVETKQDKIDADMVGVTMSGGDVDLPALLTYGTSDGNNGNDGLLGNKIGLLTYADYWNNFGDWTENYSPTTGWTSDTDNVVPTLRLVASELRKLYWTPNNSGEFTSAINNYSTLFNGTTGNWPNSFESYGGPLVTLTVFGNALALKQNKIAATSDGTNNTPNYVYNATTNSTADGSVLTTTTTAGIVGERGIATAPTYDANDNLTNGSWLPTMSAVESMVSGSDVSSHLVNGQPLSNNQITLYGTSDSTATIRDVTLYDYSNPNSPTPIEMDALVPGTVIVIKPTVDQTGDESFMAIRITNLPGGAGRKPAYYHGNGIVPAVAKKIWKADSPTVWVYDGTSFNYVSGGLDSGLLTLDWDGNRHPGIINAYNTDFDSGTGHWYDNERNRVVPSTTFAQGLALKQNVLPAQASGAPVTIPTYPAYGTSDGVIGKMYLDTSSLYTANDEHFPSSKLINTTLSSYVPKSDALNTNDTNSNLAAVSGAPSWATTNGVASLYRVPGVASGSNWAATTMANWANDKNVPTMDTLANSLAGLYDAVGVSVEDRILNYDETGSSITNATIPVPSQINYTGDSSLSDGNQLFWLPQLDKDGVQEATQVLQHYAEDKIVPSMDELAYALDGVLQTHETTEEWQKVVYFYGVPVNSLFDVAKAIEASDNNAVALNKSGYLQTFAPTLEALMNESAELVRLINRKQDKLSGTSGNLVTYGATDGTTGSKEIATTITNNANTVPNTAAVYNAVNARQNIIPVAGNYRSSNTATSDTPISDWTATNIKGTALVTKPTSSNGVVGERKIFEAGDTYTDNTTTNIQIATIGAVMENTFTKTCAEYRPGTTGETTANCWLWQLTSNTVTPACSANGTTCSSNSACCSNYCNTASPRVCANSPEIICAGEGASCSIFACCTGLTCNSQTNTCVNALSGGGVIKS